MREITAISLFAGAGGLDLGILVLTFGFTVDITVAGILGIVIAIIIYRLL